MTNHAPDSAPALLERRLPARPAQRGRKPVSTPAAFLQAQAVNAWRNSASLRPFRHDEFGTDPASPSPAQIDAANRLLARLRSPLLRLAQSVDHEAGSVATTPTPAGFQSLLNKQQAAVDRTKLIERIWQYYLELFGQRQTRFGKLLQGLDRMALDCYQAVYTGLGKERSIPTPPPLTYMETGFTPATFRRGVRLSRLGRNINPFPIVKLPYHRIVNPWTLGAVHHEVSHNIQNDLGLWQVVPKRIVRRLLQTGMPPQVAQVWGRWHKEIWADLCAALLGGPDVVTSLVDVLARSPRATLRFSPAGVHPTPYLRTLINTELLRHMGFEQEATETEKLWTYMYPPPARSNIPPAMLGTFPEANRTVIETICYLPYPQLGNKSLAQVFSFNNNHAAMTKEAAQRLARGVDPGIIPARFLVGAARQALNQRLTTPNLLTRHFYQALGRR